jgi:hypothetical protein
MIKIVQLFIAFMTMIFFLACGAGSEENSNSSSEGTAQLGNLKDANVSIYKIENNGSFSLLWNETTSSGVTLDQIGKFDTHSDKLNNEDYYLYKVVGGKDCDVNDDGILDKTCSENNGTIRLIAKGSDIKTASNNLRITYISEIVYEAVYNEIKNHFDKTKLEQKLKNVTSILLKKTYTNDSVKYIQNMIQFNPVKDKDKLIDCYKNKSQDIINIIHNGNKTSLTKFLPVLGFYNNSGSDDIILNMTLSKDGTKAYLVTYKKFEIVDVSDPKNPKLISSLEMNNGYNIVLSKDGTKAYVVGMNNGLKVIDISDPKNPKNISVSNDFDNVSGIVLSKTDNTKAYLINDNLFEIVDISDLMNPKIIDYVEMNGYALKLIVSSDETKAYVLDRYALEIIDISDSENLKVLSSNQKDITIYDIALSKDDKSIYLATKHGVEELNVTDPGILDRISLIDTADSVYKVVPSKDGTKAYFVNNNGLEVFDIDSMQLSSIAISDRIFTITLSEDDEKAYLINNFGMEILNLNFLNEK